MNNSNPLAQHPPTVAQLVAAGVIAYLTRLLGPDADAGVIYAGALLVGGIAGQVAERFTVSKAYLRVREALSRARGAAEWADPRPTDESGADTEVTLGGAAPTHGHAQDNDDTRLIPPMRPGVRSQAGTGHEGALQQTVESQQERIAWLETQLERARRRTGG